MRYIFTVFGDGSSPIFAESWGWATCGPRIRHGAQTSAFLRVKAVDVSESCKPAEGIADKELSALLRRERLVPLVHGTTYDELEQVSLLLASRAGLNTAEESMAEVATKIAELVAT
jgi:hypothetical protein